MIAKQDAGFTAVRVGQFNLQLLWQRNVSKIITLGVFGNGIETPYLLVGVVEFLQCLSSAIAGDHLFHYCIC